MSGDYHSADPASDPTWEDHHGEDDMLDQSARVASMTSEEFAVEGQRLLDRWEAVHLAWGRLPDSDAPTVDQQMLLIEDEFDAIDEELREDWGLDSIEDLANAVAAVLDGIEPIEPVGPTRVTPALALAPEGFR